MLLFIIPTAGALASPLQIEEAISIVVNDTSAHYTRTYTLTNSGNQDLIPGDLEVLIDWMNMNPPEVSNVIATIDGNQETETFVDDDQMHTHIHTLLLRPIPAGSTQQVRLEYDLALESSGALIHTAQLPPEHLTERISSQTPEIKVKEGILLGTQTSDRQGSVTGNAAARTQAIHQHTRIIYSCPYHLTILGVPLIAATTLVVAPKIRGRDEEE